jgi:HlyD family secretion protein
LRQVTQRSAEYFPSGLDVKQTLIFIVIGLAVAVAGWFGYRYATGGSLLGVSVGGASLTSSNSSDGGAAQPREARALGRLEPAGGVIAVAAQVGDRLKELTVAEGGMVTQGEPLGEMESRQIRELEVQSLEIQIAEAKARLQAETEVAQARVDTAEKALERAQQQGTQITAQKKQISLLSATLALEQKNGERLVGLSDEIVSEQQRERQTLLVQKVAAELTAARAMLRKMTQESQFAVSAAEADVRAANAGKEAVASSIPVESLKKSLELAQLQKQRSVVTAPIEGTILRVYTRPGEFITAKPILHMANLNRMVCIAEVYQTDIQRVRLGQTAWICSKTLSADESDGSYLQGQVKHIGQMISTPGLKAIDPLASTDRHVVEVRIELDDSSSRRAADFVNLQVDVIFKP